MKTEPNHNAFPLSSIQGLLPEFGFTKREYFAGLAMQGLCANPMSDDMTAPEIAEEAIRRTDALIAELNKGE
jgi:hypothetical protein